MTRAGGGIHSDTERGDQRDHRRGGLACVDRAGSLDGHGACRCDRGWCGIDSVGQRADQRRVRPRHRCGRCSADGSREGLALAGAQAGGGGRKAHGNRGGLAGRSRIRVDHQRRNIHGLHVGPDHLPQRVQFVVVPARIRNALEEPGQSVVGQNQPVLLESLQNHLHPGRKTGDVEARLEAEPLPHGRKIGAGVGTRHSDGRARRTTVACSAR